jgi:hypothetical protein
MNKRSRVIGTSPEAISRAETAVGFQFPYSFREWLLQNNGLGIEGVNIFPVFDERDPRKTWSSITRESEIAREYWADVFDGDERSFDDLLAFANFGTGDYYCFDYSVPTEPGEYLVVHVSHETGDRTPRANTFSEFVAKIAAGEFDND